MMVGIAKILELFQLVRQSYYHMVKSHEMDSLWVPVRNSGGQIITLFKKYSYLIDYILLCGR